ncbi:MAG: ABC transporter ATP-binding protein [Candidatus Moranbacteria bacterium]|nr:ABC transporter ATP-binding protein [Candidatus Moranbacteria bacterium]
MNEIAIKVENVSKTFRIPHEKINTMRGAFVNMFNKKTYEEFKALDNVSFEVKKGEFFGIIGRNGSGKSTLLKILAGIYQSDNGKVEINGRISPFLELGIGFNPELSGRDNIYLNATVLGLSRRQIEKKFDEIVAFSELERFIDQKLRNYSSGMQVRLAFSVAIHANRDILLMDEALAVGDFNFQKKCLDIFRQFKKEGKTIFLVSHSMETIGEFCDKVILLDNGKIIDIGKPENVIMDYYRNLMADTEDAEGKKENEKKEKNKKEKKVEKEIKSDRILSIKLLNKDELENNVFKRGDKVIAQIELQIKNFNERLHVGLAIIEKNKNLLVCANNTYFDEYNHSWKEGKNVIQIVFPEISLNRGDFYLASNLFIGDPIEKRMLDYYDSREEEYYFQVVPENRRNGIFYAEHEWKHL